MNIFENTAEDKLGQQMIVLKTEKFNLIIKIFRNATKNSLLKCFRRSPKQIVIFRTYGGV
jgi:hypothetical protein